MRMRGVVQHLIWPGLCPGPQLLRLHGKRAVRRYVATARWAVLALSTSLWPGPPLENTNPCSFVCQALLSCEIGLAFES
jgi:hypothetical protein